MNKLIIFIVALCWSVLAQAAEIQPGDITHLGRYKAPGNFDFGGAGLALNPRKDGIYLSNWANGAQHTAELMFPSMMGGRMTVRQRAVDAYGGLRSRIGPDSGNGYIVGGMMVYQNELIMTAFAYYNGEPARLSHFRRPLDLDRQGVTGPLRVGSMNAEFYAGYMAEIPKKHQAALGGPAVTGLCCTSIISRTSFGPSLHVFDPQAFVPTAQPLVYYPEDRQTLGAYGQRGSHPTFNGSTRITGVVFLGDTVLFIGGTGTGAYCYGTGAACNDPISPYKGEHAYPYRLWAWAYRVSDLTAVKNGSLQPWEVMPYENWDLGVRTDPDFGTGGAAFDSKTGRLYVALRHGFTGTVAEVEVFKVRGG